MEVEKQIKRGRHPTRGRKPKLRLKRDSSARRTKGVEKEKRLRQRHGQTLRHILTKKRYNLAAGKAEKRGFA